MLETAREEARELAAEMVQAARAEDRLGAADVERRSAPKLGQPAPGTALQDRSDEASMLAAA